ncbi:urease accessory protein UreH domain-containing protein [Trichothermofontia sp.]
MPGVAAPDLMLDLLLIAGLGFLGSFGHCLGMCGPLTLAFSLSQPAIAATPEQPWRFHLLLNLGRILSYALVGASIGAIGSVLVASGQMAGVGSLFRQGIAIFTGLLLIWFGLVQLNPHWLPQVPFLNPMAQAGLHDRLSRGLQHLSLNPHHWTPLLLGLVWGLIPCGFLYAAQLKAAETANLWQGGATMLAFGLGTFPMMLGVGTSTTWLSRDRRSQLFRLGGWITLTIGVLTLLRSGDMVDYTGHASLGLLWLALIARPLSRFWPAGLSYRRVFGVGAFILALAHMAHMVTMGWNVAALPFLLPTLQVGGWAGVIALVLMIPLALTSFDQAQKRLGPHWRSLHLLSIPIFILAITHALLLGSSYLGSFAPSSRNWWVAGGLTLLAGLTLLLRWRRFWSLLCLEEFYVSPK